MGKTKQLFQKTINLQSSKRKFYLVFAMVAFAFVFVHVFEPFGIYINHSSTAEDIFVEISIAMLVAFVVLLVSQFALRELFKIKIFSIITAILWFGLEAILVASSWTLLDIIKNNSVHHIFENWTTNLILYALLMLIPYSLYLIYIAVIDKFKELKSVNETKQTSTNEVREFTITDETSKTHLTLNENNLLYIQSANNYLEIHFLKEGLPNKQLIRNSIKAIETIFTYSKIIRCHRSFMVNTSQIELAKKVGSSYQLQLKKLENIQIPVSKSYQSELKKCLSMVL